jgi:glycosyltransferase involved in cell wall biosynthesis
MRITFLLPHAGLSGGVRVVSIYAQRLQQRGHKVTILSTPFRLFGLRQRARNLWFRLNLWARGQQEPSHLNGIGVEHRRLPSPDWLNPDDVPESDVIVATWWETAERLASLPASRGAPVYFLQGYETHDTQPVERVKATWRLPMQKIVVARWLADLARDEFDDKTAVLVPNAVDLAQFAVPPRDRRPVPSVGLLYSSHHFKGSDIAVKAIEIARRTLPDLQVRAFGLGDESECDLPTGTRYTSLPPQNQLKDIYSACDAWLFTSRREGFGLPILEAMACRTPVIATPAGAAPELVGAGGGLLVKPDDPEDMAQAILRIMSLSNEQWKALSNAAHVVAARYTWDDATSLFESALRKAIRRSTVGANRADDGRERERCGVDSMSISASAAGG